VLCSVTLKSKYFNCVVRCITGKMFKSADLPMVIEFLLMFHRDKPIDWLLDHLLYVKVCNPEKDKVCCTDVDCCCSYADSYLVNRKA
jgi:hypothetical protein